MKASLLSPKQRSQRLLSKSWTKQGLLRYRHDWHSTCHQARAKNLTSVVLFTFNVALASIFGQKNFKSVRYLSLIPLVKSYVTHFPKFHCAQKMCIKSSSKIYKLKHFLYQQWNLIFFCNRYRIISVDLATCHFICYFVYSSHSH